MECACGHHHAPPLVQTATCDTGKPVALAAPLVALTGRLICADRGQMMTALSLLPDHVALSRAETGNLRFDLAQDDDPLIWHLSELFCDAEAFAAHQARTADSAWGRDSTAITRDFERHAVMPVIRTAGRQDAEGIATLSHARPTAQSLVAVAAGTVIGFLDTTADPADGAPILATLIVHPRMRRRGIGRALAGAALTASHGLPIRVGDDGAALAQTGFVRSDGQSGAQILTAPAA